MNQVGETELVNALLDIGAYGYYRHQNDGNPYIFTSSRIAPDYTRTEAFISHVDERDLVIDGLIDLVAGKVGLENFDLISSGVTKDIPFGAIVADRIRKPLILLRKKQKGHGDRDRVIGDYKPEQKVIHVADLITYGTSAVSWINLLRNLGLKIDHYFSVVDRMEGGREALAELEPSVNLHALIHMDEDFYGTVVRRGLISQNDYDEIMEFRQNPKTWAMKYLRANTRFVERHTDPAENQWSGVGVISVGYPELLSEFQEYEWFRELQDLYR